MGGESSDLSSPSAETEQPGAKRWAPILVGAPLLALAYYSAGRLGLQLAVLNESATTVWPPTGIALAACLVFGLRLWPGIFVGALLVNLATSGSWPASLGIAVGNTLEAVLGCWLVQRYAGGRLAFERASSVFRFTLCAPLLSTAVSATLGVLSLILSGKAEWAQFQSIWSTWWFGDMGGDLIVAPLLILWCAEPWPRWEGRRILEGLSLSVVLLLLGSLVFEGGRTLPGRSYAVGFLSIPVILWASFQFRPRGTSAVLFLLSAGSLWGTLRLTPTLTPESRSQALVLLQAFLGMISITALAVSAAVDERRRALEELVRLNRQLDARKDEIRMYHGLLTHDITNVASALLGLADRLLLQADGPLSAKQEELLRRVNRQALEMNRMGENARMLVQIRDQGLTPSLRPVLVQVALERAIRLIRDIHFDRKFEVRVDCPADVTVSRLPLLDNVLVNLLDNGVRHSPPAGKSELEVRVRSDGPQTTIVIEGGAPPPPEVVAHLFERAVKGSRSSGHGIGLMLVREALQRSGGAIAARPVLRERGDVFEVTLTLPRG